MSNNDIIEINLSEYTITKEIKDDKYTNELEKFLDDIWKRRDKNDSQYTNNDEPDTSTQRILSLLRQNQIKQNNYVGVINFKGKTFNLLPKIFKDEVSNLKNSTEDGKILENINLNILWWLSYTNKIKFPRNISSISKFEKHSFLEVMIWHFATYTKETLTNNLFQNYEDVESETTYVKGQFMFNEYINNYLARAKWDKVYCRYDSFELDNNFNRIIKYVSILLMNFTQVNETKRCLQDIIFILNEVTDVRSTVEDCNKVKINHFQNEFETILEYCKLFLSNSISVNYRNKLELFAFLIPMEKLFEDFVFGFIEREFKEETKLKIEKQKTGINLTVQNGYKLRPDLEITYNGVKYLADTKYKIVYSNDKKQLSQNDLYQMVAYAIRYKCENIILFYPDTDEEIETKHLQIVDEFSNKTINIFPHCLPIKFNLEEEFKENIDNTKGVLIELINGIFVELSKEK